MALVTLAVVGKENVPLYLRDFVSRQEPLLYSEVGEEEEEEEKHDEEEKDDPFGFFESKVSKANDSSSLKNQVRKQILICEKLFDTRCSCLYLGNFVSRIFLHISPAVTFEFYPWLKFIIHSALDRFDELTKPECMKDRPTIGPNSMYIGLLGCFDELKVYGKLYYIFFSRKLMKMKNPFRLTLSSCFVFVPLLRLQHKYKNQVYGSCGR